MRLIDADALVKSIDVSCTVSGKENAIAVVWCLNKVVNLINAAPTVKINKDANCGRCYFRFICENAGEPGAEDVCQDYRIDQNFSEDKK